MTLRHVICLAFRRIEVSKMKVSNCIECTNLSPEVCVCIRSLKGYLDGLRAKASISRHASCCVEGVRAVQLQ